MDIESKRPKRRVRIKGTGLAVVTMSPPALTSESLRIRKQVARTISFPKDFNSPDIEVLYKLDEHAYTFPLIGHIHKQLQKGVRFAAGDRLVFHSDIIGKDCTVELRAAEEEDLLRAVILEFDTDYQSLPTDEAIAFCVRGYETESELFDSYEVDDSLFDDLV